MAQESRASNDPAWKAFEGLYTEYLRQLGDIWDELTKRIGEAQRAYAASVSEIKSSTPIEEARATHEAAQRQYGDAVRAVWNESQGRYSDAYANYLGAYRDALTNTKSPDMSPETMAVAAQSAAAAAGYASATIANWSLIAWAGVPPSVLSPARSS